MSSAVRDLAEAEFVGPRDRQNNPLPAKPKAKPVEYKQFIENNLEPLIVSEALGNAQAEWTLRNVLNAGKLFQHPAASVSLKVLLFRFTSGKVLSRYIETRGAHGGPTGKGLSFWKTFSPSMAGMSR